MRPNYLQIIEEELERQEYPNRPSELYEPIRYILSLGGKRVRPVLCLMAAELFDADIRSKEILELAIALEIFHNFSLVHDDIMDEAPLRRGKPTVHSKWNRDVAILSGDVMLVQAYDAILRSKNQRTRELIAQFNRSARLVCEGQQLDMNFESSSKVSLEEYIEMIGLKTAELIASSIKMGAIAADASDEDIDSLFSFGYNLGIAFQIQDDYLDAFGETNKVGKQKGGDILANKKTFLLLKSYELAKDSEGQLLSEAMQLEGDEKVASVLQLFEKLGAKEQTRLAMDSYFEKAMEDIARVSVDESKKSALIALANSLMKRDH